MKKCASCTKDLPDAALHCVFCGAKQPPAPATSGGVAKTVMGYSAQELIEQMKQQQAASRQTPPASQNPYPAPRATNVPGGSDATVMGHNTGQTGATPLVPNQFGNPSRPMPPSGPIGGPVAGPSGSMPSANASGGQSPMQGNYAPLNAGGGGPVPTAGNVAPTMFAQPAPSFPQPSGPMGHGAMGPGPMGPGPMGPGPGPVPANAAPTVMVNVGAPAPSAAKTVMAQAPIQPVQPMPAPPAPMPSPQPPPMSQPVAQPVPARLEPSPGFQPGQTAARVGRPIEPWKDSLRTQMFIWGGALLAAFLIPMSIDPFKGNWDAIIDGEGTAKLPPLIVAAVGLLAVALAAIPTSPSPRALMAAMLGLTGVLVPIFLPGMPPWQSLASIGGMVLLLPGLLMRTEYRDALLPRLLITIGALAAIAPFVVPVGDDIPIVVLFKLISEAEGKAKIIAILPTVLFVALVLTLLAWLPSPSSGLSNVLLWVHLVWPLIVLVLILVLDPDKLGDVATKETGKLVSWIDGLNGLATAAAGDKELALLFVLMGGAVATGFGVLIAYGGATILGKKLE